jgi:ribosomal protein S18 acetylase RimI-like enzyme
VVELIGQLPLPQQRSRINEENLWEFCLVIAREGGGEVYEGSDVKWTCTPGPLFNRIFAASFPEDQANERIADVVGEFLSRGSKASWITGPSTRPANLGTRLEHCGFASSVDWVAMDADLDSIVTDLAEPDGCRIEEVRDDPTLHAWIEAMCSGFGFGPDARESAHRHMSSMGFGDESALRHYVAYINDTPAAASTVFFGSRAAGVYFVATIPSARRKGLANAVTRRGLEESRRRGYATAVLQASRMGEPLYRKMGFVRRSTMGLYFLDVPNRPMQEGLPAPTVGA